MEVEPIRDMKDVKRMYDWLNENITPREAECFLIGCNVALRASDLLRLRFDQFGKNAEFIDLNEKKTGKFKRIPITPVVRQWCASLLTGCGLTMNRGGTHTRPRNLRPSICFKAPAGAFITCASRCASSG